MNLLKQLFYPSQSTTLTVTSSHGFHLRPVAQFVATAKTFVSDIKANYGEKSVNAKAVNSLLSLNLEKENTFTLQAKGKDAQDAIEALQATFERLMQTDTALTQLSKATHSYQSSILQVESITAGIAIAPIIPYTTEASYTPNDLTLQEASKRAQEELHAQYENDTHHQALIYLAQKELLLSLTHTGDSLQTFEQRIEQEIHTLEGGKLETKRVDYLDILQHVKKHLGYHSVVTLSSEPFILLADDLLPSDITLLEQSKVQGVILKNTTTTSHTAILLRAANIPSVISTQEIEASAPIILDALASVLVLAPTPDDITQAKALKTAHKRTSNQAYSKRYEPAKTTTGIEVNVLANVTDVESAIRAKEEGASGIGLLRTEFLFKNHLPSIKEQQHAYEEIFSHFSEITVRTLDIGGDKSLPYITLPKENNPFLGIRGIRLLHTHPQMIENQLLAIFLATKEKALKIMFPMIATVEEFIEAKAFSKQVADKHNLDISHIQFGIMVEVPSTLFLIPEFNKVVDFYSIGTNDLTQYLFAIERTHPTLNVDTLSPVIFSALEKILKESTKPVSICGELASEPKAIEKLLKLGINTLSMSPKRIATLKALIRNI